MRASVRMTRYLESWGAARPFAHLNQRESVSSSETLVSHGRRPKVGPSSQGAGSRGPGKGQGAQMLRGPSILSLTLCTCRMVLGSALPPCLLGPLGK